LMGGYSRWVPRALALWLSLVYRNTRAFQGGSGRICGNCGCWKKYNDQNEYGIRRRRCVLKKNEFALKLRARNEESSESPRLRCTILGGGSFGLAMACVTARNGIGTTVLMRNKEHAQCINEERRHPRYLSDITLPLGIHATVDEREALRGADFLIHAVPVQSSRRYLRKIAKLIPANAPILCTSKGIEKKSLDLMCEILPDILGIDRGYAFLSGPSFAREIANGLATAVVVASDDRRLAYEFSAILSSQSFRVFTSQDVVGLEVGGAVKNVIALAAGMAEGLDLGTNAVTALVTRGCYEMQRLALAMGGRSSTVMGLSGVGDTFGTCFGPLSRNRNFGIRLGSGEKLQDILQTQTEVAEGVETAFALEKLIKTSNRSYRLDLKFPIILGVVDILRGNRTPREGLEDLMLLPIRPEFLGPDQTLHSSSGERGTKRHKSRGLKSGRLFNAVVASAKNGGAVLPETDLFDNDPEHNPLLLDHDDDVNTQSIMGKA